MALREEQILRTTGCPGCFEATTALWPVWLSQEPA